MRLETEPELAVNRRRGRCRTPQDFSVAHNALKVLVPPESGAARRDLLRLEHAGKYELSGERFLRF